MKKLKMFIVLSILLTGAIYAWAGAPVPNTFTSGTVASSSEVNANFSDLADRSWDFGTNGSDLVYNDVGNVGIGTLTPAAALDVNGYSKLGPSSPIFAMQKFTGTMAATEGANVNVATGLSQSKIISTSLQVTSPGGTQWLPQPFNLSPGYEAQWIVRRNNWFNNH
jgi:hypothetical protein